MIEVFRTNVEGSAEAARLVQVLHTSFPESRINFDLDDCDRILRIEGMDFVAEKIVAIMEGRGFTCSVLES